MFSKLIFKGVFFVVVAFFFALRLALEVEYKQTNKQNHVIESGSKENKMVKDLGFF